ncbi:MAG TPA: hypothetical protein VG759_07895 [Candidatus Angelobacter sp.]|nr:hypothetical protein [Candidatus Angelobacter sp.]
MIFAYIGTLFLVIAVAAYLSAFRPRQPFPNGIRGVTAYIESVHFQSLEKEIQQQYFDEDPEGILQLPKVQQRWIQRKRLLWLERQALAMIGNVTLYCSGAAWELEQRNHEAGQPSDRERISALILQSAPQCLLALKVLQLQIKLAKGLSHMQPSTQSLGRPFVWVLDSATRKYAELTDQALTVAQSYGGVHYENLLFVLGT